MTIKKYKYKGWTRTGLATWVRDDDGRQVTNSEYSVCAIWGYDTPDGRVSGFETAAAAMDNCDRYHPSLESITREQEKLQEAIAGFVKAVEESGATAHQASLAMYELNNLMEEKIEGAVCAEATVPLMDHANWKPARLSGEPDDDSACRSDATGTP